MSNETQCNLYFRGKKWNMNYQNQCIHIIRKIFGFVRNWFQGHDMESWYQNIVPSQVVWTRHRHITPRLILSLIWVQESRSSGTRAFLLVGALGQRCLACAKRVHGMAGQAVVRWTYKRTCGRANWQTDMSPIRTRNYLSF